MGEREPYIDGVFNYCDRWCERCPFTASCRLYALELESDQNLDSRDPVNAAFWETVHGVFEQTKQMLAETAREHGIDLDEADIERAARDEEERHRRVEEHALVRQAVDYARLVAEWMQRRDALFEQKQEELIQQLALGVEGLDPEGEALRIRDALDVIAWYQYQIQGKLMRALSKDPEDDDPRYREFAAYDADGSAKVALIAIDRSIAGWSMLRESFPDEGDALLDLLVRLDRLRRATEQWFPRARAFVRPGFDTLSPGCRHEPHRL